MCEHLMLRKDAYAWPEYNNIELMCALFTAIVMHSGVKMLIFFQMCSTDI